MHWEDVCKRVCFTQVNTLEDQYLRGRELPAARQQQGKLQQASGKRERRSWHRNRSWPRSVSGPAEGRR